MGTDRTQRGSADPGDPIIQRPSHDARPSAHAPLSARLTAPVPAPPHRLWFGSISWLLAWEQRRSAVRCCREMLALHAKACAAHPGLSGMALYRLIVAARLGVMAASADTVLLQAEQSYSIWPVDRALRFREIVHYLAVTEFAEKYGTLPWLAADTTRIVNEVIPSEL